MYLKIVTEKSRVFISQKKKLCSIQVFWIGIFRTGFLFLKAPIQIEHPQASLVTARAYSILLNLRICEQSCIAYTKINRIPPFSRCSLKIDSLNFIRLSKLEVRMIPSELFKFESAFYRKS